MNCAWSPRAHAQPSRSTTALLLCLLIAGCSTAGSQLGGTANQPSPEATIRPSQSPGNSWLDAIPQFVYREQACDPANSAIKSVTLPPAEYREGRISAACVALEWLDNKALKLPKVEVFVPDYVSSAARRSIEQSAKWQLRVIWEHRTFDNITPTAFIFDSKRFLCTKDHVALSEDFYVYRECGDLSTEWTCEGNPDTALGAGPGFGWAADPPRAGFIGFSCRIDYTATVNPFKFYLGLLICDTTSGVATPLCYDWSKGAYYIFGNYLAELGRAEVAGRNANLDLCSWAKWVNTCPSSPALFRRYISSAEWLTIYDTYCDHGSDLYGETGTCSPTEHLGYTVNGLAFEWVTAHYGLDAAYGLIRATMVAERDRERYIRILERYLGMTAEELFAAIDEYVIFRLGDRILE